MTSPKHASETKLSLGSRKKVGAASSVPTLYYFDVDGLAEPIRFCFVYGNVDFIDVRFSLEKWTSYYKDLSPTGTAPWLEVDGEQFAESFAIMQYAAKRSGLVPQLTEDYIAALGVVEVSQAARKKLYGLLREEMVRLNAVGLDLDARARAMVKLIGDGSVFEALRPLDDLVARTQDAQGYIIGGEMSFVDMLIATTVRSVVNRVSSDLALLSRVEEALPHMYRTMQFVYSQPAIRKWVTQHESVPGLYCKKDSVDGRIVRLALSVAGIEYEYKGESDIPRLTIQEEELALGVRPCCLWVNSRYQIMPAKSNVQILNMWSLVELVCGMASMWKKSEESSSATSLRQINKLIIRNQSREGFTVGHSLSLADLAVAAFYEYYMSGNAIKVESEHLEGFRNAHRILYQIPSVLGDTYVHDAVPTLVYFNFPGKGEAIRFMCHATGIKFNDVRVPLASWKNGEYKAQSPSGKVPYMQVGDFVIAEQSGILTYLASRCDMLPTTPAGRLGTQIIESVAHELRPAIIPVFKAQTSVEKISLLNEVLPAYLSKVESLINRYKAPNSLPQYFIEDRQTWIDFLIAGIMAFFPVELSYDMTQWSSMKAIYDHIVAIPKVADYLEHVGPMESILGNANPTGIASTEVVGDQEA